eukprot:1306870-Amphidinium_carterae.1
MSPMIEQRKEAMRLGYRVSKTCWNQERARRAVTWHAFLIHSTATVPQLLTEVGCHYLESLHLECGHQTDSPHQQ